MMTVWGYMTTFDYQTDEYHPHHRHVFFYVGSIDYNGSWMGPSDCFWIVPTPNPWLQEDKR